MAREHRLVLENDGFHLQGERYSYGDVERLLFHYEQVQKTLNFIASGIDHHVTLGIYVRGRRKPLMIEVGPRILSFHGVSWGQSKSKSLISKYREIAERTWAARAQSYTDALNSRGYFHYDGKKINRNGIVEGDGWTFNLASDRPILRRPFSIWFEQRSDGWLRKTRRMGIATVVDEDIFMSLLDQLYDLRWS